MKITSFLALALSLISVDICKGDNDYGKKKTRGKIIQGFETQARPWMALLEHSSGFCGGTLYTKRAVITAAHCTLFDTEEWKAHVNRFKRIGGPNEVNSTTHNVIERKNHPEFIEGEFRFDVSIWFLNTTSQERTEVYLDNGIELLNKNKHLKIIGWGNVARTDDKGDTVDGTIAGPSDVLLEAAVPLNEDKFCVERYPNDFDSTVMICTGYDHSKAGTCQGDSGGPVFRETNNVIALIGLVSNGIGCAYKDYYNMETKVSNPQITAFILDTIFALKTKLDSTNQYPHSITSNPITSSQYQSSKLPSGYASGLLPHNNYIPIHENTQQISLSTNSYTPLQLYKNNYQGQSLYPNYLSQQSNYAPNYLNNKYTVIDQKNNYASNYQYNSYSPKN